MGKRLFVGSVSYNTTDESLRAARNREATARFCWSPYMHNPKLKGRLHRINIPTLFLWGTADRMIGDGYGHANSVSLIAENSELVVVCGALTPRTEQCDSGGIGRHGQRVQGMAAPRLRQSASL